MFALAASNSAALCEQASPVPAIHMQWADNTSPLRIVATHTLRGGVYSLCKCLVKAINIKLLAWQSGYQSQLNYQHNHYRKSYIHPYFYMP